MADDIKIALNNNDLDFELYNYKRQKNFINWQYSKIKPFLKGDILEVGSGIGTISEKIIKEFNGKIYLTEIKKEYLDYLKTQFKSKKRVKIGYLDITNKKYFSKIKNKFDSILCVHVLEHVEDDVLALNLMKTALKSKGNLVIIVPAHKFLFSSMDIAEGHYRRYRKNEIELKAKEAGFKIKSQFWFNLFAIPARFVNGNLFKLRTTHQGSFNLYNKLLPILIFFEEKIFWNITGVNRIIILEK